MKTLADLWSTVAADPVTLAAALMMAAALLALLLIATPARGESSSRAPQRRPAQARSLAAHGTKPDEIARRTGLSHDAVALVLGEALPADMRKGRPGTARIAPKSAHAPVKPEAQRAR